MSKLKVNPAPWSLASPTDQKSSQIDANLRLATENVQPIRLRRALQGLRQTLPDPHKVTAALLLATQQKYIEKIKASKVAQSEEEEEEEVEEEEVEDEEDEYDTESVETSDVGEISELSSEEDEDEEDSDDGSDDNMERSELDKCEKTNPSTGKPCNTIFSRSYDLTRHEDTIHNSRKQKVRCHLCTEEKTFSRNDALTRHMRVVQS